MLSPTSIVRPVKVPDSGDGTVVDVVDGGAAVVVVDATVVDVEDVVEVEGTVVDAGNVVEVEVVGDGEPGGIAQLLTSAAVTIEIAHIDARLWVLPS
jgi:hypothetical protein